MKHRLQCILFGHKFLREETRVWEDRSGGTTTTYKSDICWNCGLTKKECGIKEG